MGSLRQTFKDIKRNHRRNLLRRAARVVLGASVMRVFKKGTKDDLLEALVKLPIDELKRIRNQSAFTAWFERQLDEIAKVILVKNPKSGSWSAVHPGYKWGHATKILCLYLREVVECSRYFSKPQADKINKWLFVPLDGLVIKQLQSDEVKPSFGRIKEISRRKQFMDVQAKLGDAAKEIGVPRIWYDDAWLRTRGAEDTHA